MVSANNLNGDVQRLTPEEARRLLEEQAMRYLGMSADDFIRQWEAGEIENPDRPEVMRIAMLLPLAA